MPRDLGGEEKLRAARAKVAYLRPYFSHAVYGLLLFQSERVPTVAVDEWRRLYWNPNFLADYSVAELTVILLHELAHVLRDHCKRARLLGVTMLTMHLAQLAQDAALNPNLRDELKERRAIDQLPPIPEPKDPRIQALPENMRGPFFPAKFGCPEGWVWERYYEHLLDHAEEIDIGPHDCGSGAHGVSRPWEHGAPGVSGVEGVLDADWRDIQRLTAAKIAERQRSRGDVPIGWRAWADQLLRVRRIPWDQLLAARLRSTMADVAGDLLHSYRRPSRRQSVFPNVIQPCMRRPQPFVCFVGDTSGSMDEQHDLALVRGTVQDICQSLGAMVAFLATDARVHGGVQRVMSGRNIELLGRGGTDMSVGIAYALTMLRPRPDVIVVGTDCDTPWPAARPPVPVVVCAIGEGADIAGVPSWAQVIKVEAA